MNKRSNRTVRSALLFLLCCCGAAFSPVSERPAMAQQRQLPQQTSQPVTGRDLGSRDAQIRSLEIERERRMRDPQLIMAEVNEDFSRLRELNEQLTKATASADALDYKYISESTAEIKKRSTRLKTNLVLPEPKQDETNRAFKEPSNEQLKPSLSSLDALVQSFIKNPIFSDSGAIDPQLAARARRDLEDIITLSEKIRKSAEKLDKKAAKSK